MAKSKINLDIYIICVKVSAGVRTSYGSETKNQAKKKGGCRKTLGVSRMSGIAGRPTSRRAR